MAELETELVALETAKPNTTEKPQRVGGGGGGRQRVKARQKSQSTKEPVWLSESLLMCYMRTYLQCNILGFL